MTESGKDKEKDDGVCILKDPPVIRKSKSKKNEQNSTAETVAGTDAKTSKSGVEVEKGKSVAEGVDCSEKIRDPLVSNSISVNKGDRLKPMSEKKMGKRKPAKMK